MDKKEHSTGIRIELGQGTDEAVAVDELIDDFLHGDVQGALHVLHEPHGEDHPGHDPGVKR